MNSNSYSFQLSALLDLPDLHTFLHVFTSLSNLSSATKSDTLLGCKSNQVE